MTRIGLYPGTFDPIHNGHTDIIGRAVKLVDKLVIGVAINAGKGPLFSLDERVALLKSETAHLTDRAEIVVQPFQGLLMHFAREIGWNATAFQPSCQRPRWPNISKYCGFARCGALAFSMLAAKLAPSSGCCGTPAITSGALRPIRSSSVGTMSLAWQNWWRSSPRAAMPFGQHITSGSRMPPPWVFCL